MRGSPEGGTRETRFASTSGRRQGRKPPSSFRDTGKEEWETTQADNRLRNLCAPGSLHQHQGARRGWQVSAPLLHGTPKDGFLMFFHG